MNRQIAGQSTGQTARQSTGQTAGLTAGLTFGQTYGLTHQGMPIRYGLWRGDDGGKEADSRHRHRPPSRLNRLNPLIVILPGFSEFIEKYDHVLARITDEGYDAAIIDWPGQGLSGRFLTDPTPVHAYNFDFHLACLFAVLKEVLDKIGGHRPLVFLGHSMGAHLALRGCYDLNLNKDTAVALGEDFAGVLGVVMVSPMMLPPMTPPWLALMLLWGATRIPMVAASRIPWRGQAPRNYDSDEAARDFKPNNPLTRDPDGFAHHPNMWQKQPRAKTYGASFGWAYAAYASCVATTAREEWLARLNTPVLAHLPGDERIVAREYQWRAVRHLPDCRVGEYPHARHELLLELPEVRERLWQKTWAFIAGLQPQKQRQQ